MNNFSFLKKIIEFVKKYFLKQFTLFWFLPAESAKKSATQEGALLVGLFGCDLDLHEVTFENVFGRIKRRTVPQHLKFAKSRNNSGGCICITQHQRCESNKSISRKNFLTKFHFLQFQKWPKNQF